MDFSLGHEQRLLVDTVRDFIASERAPLEDEIESTGTLSAAKARAIFERSRDLGLYATNIPEEFGGGGLSALETMLVQEQFGRTTDILIRRAFGNVYEVPLACKGAQVERWLKPAVRGERVRLAQVAARSVGKATKILDLTIDHATDRRQFGQRLGDFQMVQQMLADSAIEINATRAALWQCAWEIDAGMAPRAKISALKVQASEMPGRVVDRAMQIFGGMGLSRDLPIERYYRDARIYRVFDGASEIHRGVVAKLLLKGGKSLYDPYV